MQRAKHIRFFSVVYISTPKRSDIKRSVIIAIQNINFTILICTLKNLASAFTNVLTARTGLTCVRRFYNYQLNTIKQGFIFKERPQLTKIPTSEFCSKLFVSTFIGRQKFYFQCQLHVANIQIIFLYQKIITNFVKQFKAWQSHSSHRAFAISGFTAPIL